MFLCISKRAAHGALALFFGAAAVCGVFLATRPRTAAPVAAEVEPEAVPASAHAWGLSFQKDGEPPVPNLSAEELRPYNAFYCGEAGQKPQRGETGGSAGGLLRGMGLGGSFLRLAEGIGGALGALAGLVRQLGEAENWTFAVDEVEIKRDAVSSKNVKSSQFAKPYFEFSGACAGCGETPYIKLVTQLFGDRMYITNASGCSSAYGGSTPSSPYCADKKGFGPAWAMSLFEDNAEYAYGYLLGQDAVKRQLAEHVHALAESGVAADACNAYLEKGNDPASSREVSDNLLAAIENEPGEDAAFVRQNKEFLTKKSVWAFGGDGWAYDIGYGGLDHVLASGKDINVLVLDTEVYSNTGGQSSKSTAAAAIAKFAAGGKETKKKDLGLMAMSYGYVYVAQVAMGADPAQTLRAIREAEAYPGPSLVICYCPCIEHGMKCGMGLSQAEEKKAVECGYWHLYRYNPALKAEGKNPFTLDSKEPTGDFQKFLMGQNRYASLKLSFPGKADELYAKAASDAKERLESYKNLAK